MRISDWSSDVCSSDLAVRPAGGDACRPAVAATVDRQPDAGRDRPADGRRARPSSHGRSGLMRIRIEKRPVPSALLLWSTPLLALGFTLAAGVVLFAGQIGRAHV